MLLFKWYQDIPFSQDEFKEFINKWEYCNLKAYCAVLPFLSGTVTGTNNFDTKLFTCYIDQTPIGFFIDNAGILGLPFFPPLNKIISEPEYDAFNIVSSFPLIKTYRTLMGPLEYIIAFEKLFNQTNRTAINYYFFFHPGFKQDTLWDSNPFDSKIKNQSSYTIRRLTVDDVKIVFPLQEAYEHEEVIINASFYNAEFCLNNLINVLGSEYTLGLFKGKKLLAKAGTNAIGHSFCQVGGIYTLPQFRNLGLSQMLVNRLLSDLAVKNKRLCLFVKKENKSAIKVYENCGFQNSGDFRISYHFGQL